MTQKQRPVVNKTIKANKKAYKKKQVEQLDLLQQIENYFSKNNKVFFWLILIVSLLTALLTFDLKVSKGGDDAAYVIRAFQFVQNFTFPSYQGPLWPMILSIPVAIFGINLSILKLLALIFGVGQFVFLLKAFRKGVPLNITYPALFMSAINAYLMYFASQTYTEALFLFLQSILLYVFIKAFILNTEPEDIKKLLRPTILTGALIFLMAITRSIGYASFIAVILFLLLEKKWKSAGFITASFISFSALFSLIKKLIWGKAGVQFSGQLGQLMQKNPYYPAEGNEDLMGFIQRFVDNSNIYLSKYFYIYQGFRQDITTVSPVLTILTYALVVLAFVVIFKRNRVLLFTGIYTTVILGITFIILQKRWDSFRLIVTNIPLLYLFIFGGLVYLFKERKLRKYQWTLLLLFIFLGFFALERTKKQATQQVPSIIGNLKGNKYMGFTPDWVNYLTMAEWVGKNIPKDKKVACRKPNLAQIYGSRKFEGIYRMPTQNADSLALLLREREIDFIIMASLRKYEQKKTQYTINTISRYLYFLQQEYPKALRQVRQIGNDEPAYLIEVNREGLKPEMK